MRFFLTTYSILLLFFSGFTQTNCSTFSTYFGGTQFDELKGVCVDANKNSYVIGNTYSNDFTITPGLINNTHSGNYDIILAKFDSCGVLIWSTYFGSSNFESGEKIALTNDGNLVFTGYTSGVTTPTTSGCFQAQNNGGYDCFITKITTNGNLIWSTYFGKSGGDFAFDIKVDAYDNIIVGGTTTSTNLYTTVASFQPIHKGNTDAFIARFNKLGQLKWCTYYGGNNSEDIHALSIDNHFNIIGIGETFSTNLNTSVGAYQNSKDGSNDVYIIKLDSSCQRVFSTYLGGNNSDDAWGVVTDTSRQIYIAGHTSSTDFDITSGVYQAINNGSFDWYISSWSPTGALIKSTLFGGTLDEKVTQMAISSVNNLVVIGYTSSTDMPLVGVGNQTTNGGNTDVFIASLESVSLTPIWSSYYGGSLDDFSSDLKLKGLNELTFVGNSNSSNYPVSASPYQSSLNMSNDGVLTKIQLSNQIPTSIKTNAIEGIMVFPNPFSNLISINGVSDFDFVLTDLLGKNMSSYIHKSGSNIITEKLDKGIYFLEINTPSKRFTIKLIKE